MPTPSAPNAAFVKLVAIEKKYAVPSSFTGSIVDISVFGTFTQLIDMSYSFPSFASSAFSKTSVGLTAFAIITSLQKPAFISSSLSFSNATSPTTLPVGPTLFLAS